MKRRSRVVAAKSWSTLKQHHCLFVRIGLCGAWIGVRRERMTTVSKFQVSGGLFYVTYMVARR
jgi:hypothetical protein